MYAMATYTEGQIFAIEYCEFTNHTVNKNTLDMLLFLLYHYGSIEFKCKKEITIVTKIYFIFRISIRFSKLKS